MKSTHHLLLAMLALISGCKPAPLDKPAKLALAHETIAAMQADKMFDSMTSQLKQMATQVTMPPPGATPEQSKKGVELQGQIMDVAQSAIKELIAKMDGIYAEVYSEEDLKAMKAFFNSPEGQSLLAKQPQVMAKIKPLVQAMQHDLMPKIQQLVAQAKGATPGPTLLPAPASGPGPVPSPAQGSAPGPVPAPQK